ncbi:methyltransferase [Pacificimonas flava]|uniref:Methyltransferase n=2 Tax=Pacificimonas TaxID=1960290 RepID=A0A219B4C4_9SPHN|nr:MULTISPECIES: class I SAM-dependent methyltransferase [Pacificimonas]MBZ6377058.1 class I SAM-dependent methyltransferase [Pacificimonas aurantium]OWV33205.1 methyltransferase [Pacificimonas flava]
MKKLVAAAAVSMIALASCAPETDDADVAAADAEAGTADMVGIDGTDMPAVGPDYETILASDVRSEDNRARDQYRHPQETLDFFGLAPGMTVVELSPGGGWYTEILAQAVGPDGRLIAVVPGEGTGNYWDRAVATGERLSEAAGTATVETVSSTFGSDGEALAGGAADMVLTFRNAHNFYMGDQLGAVMSEAFRALKPGGVLGIVEHRLPEDRDDADMDESGYMKRSTIVAAAEEAGFELADESEINANPNDTADYEDGVWTLPPTLRNGDENREEYLAIGESDRMTLKFRKPA